MNKNKLLSAQQGFTLIELLVVIAIIGVLASSVLASLNSARSKSRDARRMHDLDQIRTVMNLYYDTYRNWIGTGSGCGYLGNGGGWFNYVGGNYPKAIAQCLLESGFVPAIIIDPTGGVTSTPTNRYSYMKYTCSSGTYVYAKLENVPQSSTATDGTCCANCDSSYGMNYYLKF